MSRKRSSIIVTKPSLRSGAAKALDLFGALSAKTESSVFRSFEADRQALSQDWQNVGNSLRWGMEKARTKR